MANITRFVVPVILLTAAGVLAYRASAPASRGGGSHATPEVFTSTDLNAAMAEAAKKSPAGLVVADFTASWCGPCQTMKKQTWPDAGVVSWVKANATAVLVDVDAHQREAGAHNISGIPAIVVFRGNKEVGRSVGLLGPSELLAFLKDAQAK